MDVWARRFHAETSIRAYLVKAAELEAQYAIVKAEEIVQGKYEKTPFLKSRSVLRAMRLEISAAWKIQKMFNKKVPTMHQLTLVEGIINRDDVFVQSKKLLQKLLNNSDAQHSSMERRHIELEKMMLKANEANWPTATEQQANKFAENREVQAMIKKLRDKNKTAQQIQEEGVYKILDSVKMTEIKGTGVKLEIEEKDFNAEDDFSNLKVKGE